jgi:hypothetical protein
MKVAPVVLSKQEGNVEKFKKLFEKDVRAARIFAMSERVETEEVLYFEETPEKYQIITQIRRYGVSVTNKIYNRPRRTRRILVNGDKYHIICGYGNPSPLSYINLNEFEKEVIYTKHPFLRFLEEHNLQIPFNSIFRYKLFDLRKALNFHYKLPFNKAKSFHDFYAKKGHGIASWRKALKQIRNGENLNLDLVQDWNFFMDCVDMASKLNVKINAAWSKQRLANEHNEWSRIITDVLYSETNRPFSFEWVYEDLDEVVGGLIKDTKSLALEGMRQKHCVGTYAYKIDNGSCAIYHIEGYTAEIIYNAEKYYLHLNQFKGKFNQNAPGELFAKVNGKLSQYCTLQGLEYKAHAVPYSPLQPAPLDDPFDQGFDVVLDHPFGY